MTVKHCYGVLDDDFNVSPPKFVKMTKKNKINAKKCVSIDIGYLLI